MAEIPTLDLVAATALIAMGDGALATVLAAAASHRASAAAYQAPVAPLEEPPDQSSPEGLGGFVDERYPQ
ncbi:MAG: hypothetical protein ABIR54_07100 [Burkholderiaceae bacterium]